MSIVKVKYNLHLKPETANRLTKYAKRHNVQPEALIIQLLEEFLEDKYEDPYDPIIDEVVESVIQQEYVSIAHLQRTFSIGYNRAQRVLDQLTRMGYTEDRDDHHPRKVMSKKHLL